MYIGAPNTEPSRIVPAINWYCLLRWTFMSAATRLQLQLHFFTVKAAKVERVWFFSFCPQFFFNDFHTSHQSQSKHSTKRFNKRKNGRHGWPNPMPKSHGWWTAPGTTSERWRHLFVDEGFAVAQAGHFKGEDRMSAYYSLSPDWKGLRCDGICCNATHRRNPLIHVLDRFWENVTIGGIWESPTSFVAMRCST